MLCAAVQRQKSAFFFFVVVLANVACRCSAPAAATHSVRCCFHDAPQTVYRSHMVDSKSIQMSIILFYFFVFLFFFSTAGCSHDHVHIGEGHTEHRAPSSFLLSRHPMQLLVIVSLPFAVFHTILNVFTPATSLPDKVTKNIITLKWVCWTGTGRSFRHN